jgi:hypothetical protein
MAPCKGMPVQVYWCAEEGVQSDHDQICPNGDGNDKFDHQIYAPSAGGYKFTIKREEGALDKP